MPPPGTPDVRGPWRYLWWLIASQPWRILTGSLWGIAWMAGLVVSPYLLARAVDDGLRAGDRGALLLWVTVLALVGAGNAVVSIMRHRTMTLVRMDASLRTMRVVARHAALLGAALPRRLSSGELSTMQVLDVGRIARMLTMTGPGVGAVIAYTGVAVLLFAVSPVLAAVVGIGVPLLAALAAVDAGWARELPEGLDTPLGAGGTALDAARSQQLALARVVLADPHTVVLDEATSMLDPTTARDTERSLAAVLEGRTVIAIAHRLHTAHDADRVAVVEDGRITELGSHRELVGANGPYAALWRSWHGTP
ncbi:ABC transporter transmembrane domain-containing protein [Nocardiopsis quinghaiensis]|uniref:ABC transporter transmembrane domain-containing protein n=1 Tax=Nocardiopsis quinghaiensis TaxID=464995 RepID=UPI0037446F24